MLSLIRKRLSATSTRFAHLTASNQARNLSVYPISGSGWSASQTSRALLAQVANDRTYQREFGSTTLNPYPTAKKSSSASKSRSTAEAKPRSSTKSSTAAKKKKPATRVGAAAKKKKAKTVGTKSKRTARKKVDAKPQIKSKSGVSREQAKLIKAPKKPSNAMNIFVGKFVKASTEPKSNREEVSQVFSSAIKVWKSFSDLEKKPFEDESAAARAAYEKDLAIWSSRAIQNAADFKKLNTYRKSQGKVKVHLPKEFRRPVNGYLRYFASVRDSVDGTSTEKAREAGKLWRSLSEKEREMYNSEAHAEFVKWKKANGV